MPHTAAGPLKPGARLFLLSFAALFFELMVIRWVPSQVRLVAYYANLMLVSSFLGLGVGALLSTRGWRLFRWFAPVFAANVLLLILLGYATLPTGGDEWKFVFAEQKTLGYVMLVAIFVCNAVSFVPLGEAIGVQFQRLPALRAYSWDLSGSLAGTLFFGFFSLLHFSPILGLSMVAVVVFALSGRRHRLLAIAAYAIALGALLLSTNTRAVHWSPYYYINIDKTELRESVQTPGLLTLEDAGPAESPPVGIRTMRNPPLYSVKVNQDFYQMHGTLNPARYTPGDFQRIAVQPFYAQYTLPYQVVSEPGRVLVLGSGGGMDVEAALLNGATRVDAVEIDPLIPRISTRLSAAAPYADPRVVLHVDDARAFLQKRGDLYDMVVFGFLDSQALFSYGANIRLDGYTYTVESFRKAFGRLTDNGILSVSFFAGHEWLAVKLARMIERATGRQPLVYTHGRQVMMIVPKGAISGGIPREYLGWQLVRMNAADADLATDDWPYLYLQKRGVPLDYTIVIGLLLVISIVSVALLRGRAFTASDAHFLFMGWGFLLLQTKAIGDCSLYFGTTWFVTTLVIIGVLLMVLLANLIAARFVRFTASLYIPLFLSLLVLFVPRELILGQALPVRLLWTILAVPLPIFFAGLIFSTTFRDTIRPAAAFGANLIGATIGGFCEYLGMSIGTGALSYIIIAAYAASLLCNLRGYAGRSTGARGEVWVPIRHATGPRT